MSQRHEELKRLVDAFNAHDLDATRQTPSSTPKPAR